MGGQNRPPIENPIRYLANVDTNAGAASVVHVAMATTRVVMAPTVVTAALDHHHFTAWMVHMSAGVMDMTMTVMTSFHHHRLGIGSSDRGGDKDRSGAGNR